jgi:hypothetical protein
MAGGMSVNFSLIATRRDAAIGDSAKAISVMRRTSSHSLRIGSGNPRSDPCLACRLRSLSTSPSDLPGRAHSPRSSGPPPVAVLLKTRHQRVWHTAAGDVLNRSWDEIDRRHRIGPCASDAQRTRVAIYKSSCRKVVAENRPDGRVGAPMSSSSRSSSASSGIPRSWRGPRPQRRRQNAAAKDISETGRL